MNKPRLLKLAEFLEKLPDHKLDMKIVCALRGSDKMNPYECKSAACAMGWTPAVFPRLLRWQHVLDFDGAEVIGVADDEDACDWMAMWRFFDIPERDADVIFGAGRKDYRRPKEVAAGIREYVAFKGERLPLRMIGKRQYDSETRLIAKKKLNGEA